MKIIVCVKVVLDPEMPASSFKVDAATNKVIPPKGTPPVLNPFDENALEAALRIKESAGASVTVLSLGKNISKAVIRKSLAAGADRLVLLEDDAFEDLDACTTAGLLADAIREIGEYDVIICGREAADTSAGQVGLGIAEILGIPSVSLAGKVEFADNQLKVDRVLAYGTETIGVLLPALVTVGNEAGALRTPGIKAVMEAQKKPLTVWKAADLGFSQPQTRKIGVRKVFQPVHETKCDIVTADTPEEAAVGLARKLREAKVL
ncbi:MAG: electron transfer flavoprotein subunit beta/FixA family protein [Dehalococcoidales bacterium]